MKKERLVKGSIAVLAAAGLLFSGFRMAEVDAAVGITEPDDGCSITVQVQGNLNFEGTTVPDATVSGNDLKTQAVTDLTNPAEPIMVNLYRVAKIGTKGPDEYSFTYEALDPFDKSQDFKDDLATLDDKTSAADWREYSRMAAQLAGILSSDPADGGAVEVDLTKPGDVLPVRSVTMTNGSTEKITGLSTGLYLVAASKTYDSAYEREYSFAPYLISLPDNGWYHEMNDTSANRNDTWLYDITVGLKPQITRLFGDLKIDKTLSERNPVEGEQGASSVFRVVVTDDTKEIYNNMVSFRLGKTDNDMSDSITIGKFPAGAVATVTEVYAGAGYQAAGELTASVPIVSDKAQEKGSTVATVSFTNKSDGTLKGGYGIVNHFTEGANTTEQVQKESNSADGVENKTAYKEAER